MARSTPPSATPSTTWPCCRWPSTPLPSPPTRALNPSPASAAGGLTIQNAIALARLALISGLARGLLCTGNFSPISLYPQLDFGPSLPADPERKGFVSCEESPRTQKCIPKPQFLTAAKLGRYSGGAFLPCWVLRLSWPRSRLIAIFHSGPT